MILCQLLVSSFVLDANSLPPSPLKNMNVSSSFDVNELYIKINMLSMIPYNLKLIKYLSKQSLSFNLVFKK